MKQRLGRKKPLTRDYTVNARCELSRHAMPAPSFPPPHPTSSLSLTPDPPTVPILWVPRAVPPALFMKCVKASFSWR